MNCRWEPPVHQHNMPRRNGGKPVPSPPAPASCECEVRQPVSQSYYAPSGQYLPAGNASRRSHAISTPVLLALHTNDIGGKHTDNIPRPVSLQPQSLSSPCHGNEYQWLPGHSPAHSYKKESAKSLTTVLRQVHYLSCILRSIVPRNSWTRYFLHPTLHHVLPGCVQSPHWPSSDGDGSARLSLRPHLG